MKGTLFILSLSLFLLSCQGAKPPLESAVKWNEGELQGKVKSIISTSYEHPATPSEDSTQYAEQPRTSNVVLQVYNTKGQLSESHWYSNDSILQQRLLFEYDTDGRLVQNSYIEQTEDAQQPDYSYFVYTYDKANVTKEEHYQNNKLLGWSEKSYNSNGDIILKQSFKDGNPVSQSTYEYLYNDAGQKIEEKSYLNGAPVLTTSWEYDKNGRTVTVKTKDGEVEFSESYRYDSNDRLIEETLTPVSSNMLRISTYRYDEHGNMVEYKQRTGEGNIIHRCTYEYDEHGNWIRSQNESGSYRMVQERKIEYFE